MKILVINGPNLNLLGKREPEIYGYETLEDINKELEEYAKTLFSDLELTFFQSNSESEIIEKIQQSSNYNALIINPAAYTHTSIAISDAIKGVGILTAEVHLSNIQTREDFRKISYISQVSKGTVAGFGKNSYKMAL
ncbi:type II 3-dehydroquinate dehydratase, partial [bacterium]|nr:type II 3-dehydroquinate dehydratase [bacterium]